jgi:hypothetical protein
MKKTFSLLVAISFLFGIACFAEAGTGFVEKKNAKLISFESDNFSPKVAYNANLKKKRWKLKKKWRKRRTPNHSPVLPDPIPKGDPQPVPEPATMLYFAAGLAAVVIARKRWNKQNS